MNFADAQNLLGVPRYVSEVELRKKYLALVKIHHPDVNIDKKRANKLTSDINEAYEVVLECREQEKWSNKGSETKTVDGSLGNNGNANHQTRVDENYGIWEKQSKQTPLSKNPFWQSTFVSNFDFTPECFCFIGLTTRFPSEQQAKESYNKEIESYHPRRFGNSQQSFERCKYISLAYLAVCKIRDAEEWCRTDENRKCKAFEKDIDFVEEGDEPADKNYRYKSEKAHTDTRPKSSPKSVGNTFFDYTDRQQKDAMIFMVCFFGVLILLGLGIEGCQELNRKNISVDVKGDSLKKSDVTTKTRGLNEILELSFIKSTVTQIIETEMRKVLKSDTPFVRKLNLNYDGVRFKISDSLHGGACVVVFKGVEIPVDFSFNIKTDILVQEGKKYSSSIFHVEWSVPEILGVTIPSTHSIDLGPFVR